MRPGLSLSERPSSSPIERRGAWSRFGLTSITVCESRSGATMASGQSLPSNLHSARPFARIIFPAANSGDSIPFAANPLFGNLTEWDCTNEDHRPVICLRVDRMHWRRMHHQWSRYAKQFRDDLHDIELDRS